VAYVSRCFNRTAHDDDFLDPQEGLGVLRSSNSEVREWPDSDDGDSVWFILCQDLQHDFMCRLQRWYEQIVLFLDGFQSSGFFG